MALTSLASAWTENTHIDLSEKALENSKIGTTDYLISIGLDQKLNQPLELNGEIKTALKWIKKGAELEDKSDPLFPVIGTTRSVNHFHNPLKPWNQAGLDDSFIRHYTGESSLLWAQDTTQQQNFIEGDWSWQKIREYYYLALTSETDSERQANFAKTFRGLGHQMHLIQDAAQPDHVRNDVHPEDTTGLTYAIGFEKWAGKNWRLINALASNAELFFPQVSLNIVSYNGLAPITQFLDTDQYDGTNPDTSLTIGIAEYTNANFFSDDTIFAAERYPADHRHYFPYPKQSSTDLESYLAEQKSPETIITEDGKEDTGFWLRKVEDGETIEHFLRIVKPSFFTRHVLRRSGAVVLFNRTFYRDEKCHEDYAKKLIPRAVGYSAGLIDYFFRGELNVTVTDSGAIRISNLSSEDMDGTFRLYYDAQDGARKPVSNGSWSLVLEAGETSTTLNFTQPTDLAEDKYILVFEGMLGSESNAVAGRIWSSCPEEVKLTASDAGNNEFGDSVAISGDLAIVGSSYNDHGGVDSGSAYVFQRSGNGWVQQAKLMASDAAASDRFGFSVAISGDTAIVGTPYDDHTGVNSGSAYVFQRSGDRWVQQAKLRASDAAKYDLFGYSVTISGNVAIVGSPYDYYGSSTGYPYYFGSSYVFVRTGETWVEQTKLTAGDQAVDEDKLFGWSVAISGDVVIIGAVFDSDFGTASGAAYVFIRSGDRWVQQAKLTASDASAYKFFGWSVAISGDVSIVGTWFANSAYVFAHNGFTWREEAKLSPSDVAPGDWFGYSVALSGEIAIVGSPLDDDAGNSSGSAYFFIRNGDTWEEKKKLTASDAAANNYFGDSVAINGDVAIVGSPYYNADEGKPGSAYIKYYNQCSQ